MRWGVADAIDAIDVIGVMALSPGADPYSSRSELAMALPKQSTYSELIRFFRNIFGVNSRKK